MTKLRKRGIRLKIVVKGQLYPVQNRFKNINKSCLKWSYGIKKDYSVATFLRNISITVLGIIISDLKSNRQY